MAAKASSTGEHRVQIIMPRDDDDAGGRREGKKGRKPEKQLNCFVRIVVLIERLGNALGTLAFTWATVILLGGYPTVLRQEDDFCFATIIVFLEAARMFSKNNRTDYQVFFHTNGAVRPLGWNGLIVIVYLTNILSYLYMLVVSLSVNVPATFRKLTLLLVLFVPTILGIVRSSRALELLSKPLRDATSLLSPLVATLLLVPLIVSKFTPQGLEFSQQVHSPMAKWMLLFTLLFLVVLLLTINRVRFQRTRSKSGTKHVLTVSQGTFWHRVLLNICMFVELVMLVLVPGHKATQSVMLAYELLALLLVSFGNLQIPAALIRVGLSLLRLVPHDYLGADPEDASKINLTPSLSIFYGMVLGQGILYLAACLLGIFSFIPRRSLARRGGFRGRKGREFVKLYYAYAWDKCMENNVLARKKISLCSFALDSINSEYSPTRQLLGVQLIHKLLQMEPARTRLLSRLNASVETMARIIRMLDWRNPEDTDIRLFAAKVVAELAKSIRVVAVPGMIQLVSALLDANRKPERRSSALLDTDDEQEGKQGTVIDAADIQEENQLWDTSKLHESQACSNKQISIDCQDSCFIRFWKWISRLWSSPHEGQPPMDDHDNLLPALGMSILNSLAYCDSDNRVEISRAADLIPKIIEFTHHKSLIENISEVRHTILLSSSLQLLRRLSNTGGEIGITLRHKMSDHPVLLRNLAEILDNIDSSIELRKLAAELIRNLAVDGNISQEIGRIKVVITRLVDAFLSQDDKPFSTNLNQSLQKVAGQALAMLTMESAGNCTAIRTESNEFIEELSNMISRNKHKYVAARLLQDLFLHTQVEFRNSELRKLRETLGKVLETIMDPKTDKAELEVLIGLSSQICRVIPDDFGQELEKKNGQGKETFVKNLVDALKANMNPTVDCPGIRRVIIEHAIHLMKYGSPHYAVLFNQHGMKEALLTVEQTPSRVERFRIFMGNSGLMEHEEPVTDLVATAKELLMR